MFARMDALLHNRTNATCCVIADFQGFAGTNAIQRVTQLINRLWSCVQTLEN